MPYTMQYGSPYQVQGAGAAIAQGEREATDFSRQMKNNRMNLQKRRQELSEAQFQFEQTQAQRQWALDLAKERRVSQGQKARRELARKKEKRQQKQLEFQMERFGIKQNSQQAKQVRNEYNRLKKLGAQPAGQNVQAGKNEYLYEDTVGNKWIVPRKSPAQQRKEGEMLRKERNKLRSWKATKIDGPKQSDKGMMAYQDASGQWYQFDPKYKGEAQNANSTYSKSKQIELTPGQITSGRNVRIYLKRCGN